MLLHKCHNITTGHCCCTNAHVLICLSLLPLSRLLLLLLQEPPFDELSFSKGVTYDASEAAGAAPRCIANVRRAWQVCVLHVVTQ